MKGKKLVSKKLTKSPRPTDTELAILEILKDLKTGTVRQIHKHHNQIYEVQAGYTTILKIIQTSMLVHQIGWSLIHSLWQDLLIGLVLAAIFKLLARAKSQIRYFIACIALAAMIILPVFTTYVLHNRQTK